MSKKNHFTISIIPFCLLLFLTVLPVFSTQNYVMDQTTRLAALGKVWGFLKYYHPEVAKGEIDWDQVLITTIPAVKAAQDYDSFNLVIENMIQEAGGVANNFNAEVPAHPNNSQFKWLKDQSLFNNTVRKKLSRLQKKHLPDENYYAKPVPDAFEVDLSNENPYTKPYYPDENFRLLAVFRFWNVIEYFFPYKNIMDSIWDEVLKEHIPIIMAATDVYEYHNKMREMMAKIDDSHGNHEGVVYNYENGYYSAPFRARYIEGKVVVTKVYNALLDSPDLIKVGDIILRYQDMEIEDFWIKWSKWIAASNQDYLNYAISSHVHKGKSNNIAYKILRDGQQMDINMTAFYYTDTEYQNCVSEDYYSQDVVKRLPGNIAYVNLNVLTLEDVPQVMPQVMNTEAIIFDLRRYPYTTMHEIMKYLAPGPKDFCSISAPDFDHPGEFKYIATHQIPFFGEENPDYYKGKVICLIHEETISMAEYTVMAFQTLPNITLIGNHTAGANGNQCRLYLPGLILAKFSGQSVYYPDGTQTQRIGILPDIYVQPTVDGIKAGRDEVLERAIQFIETNE